MWFKVYYKGLMCSLIIKSKIVCFVLELSVTQLLQPGKVTFKGKQMVLMFYRQVMCKCSTVENRSVSTAVKFGMQKSE